MSRPSHSWCELKKPKIGIRDSNQSSECSFCVIEFKPSPIDRAPGAAHSQSRKNIITILKKKIFNKTSLFHYRCRFTQMSSDTYPLSKSHLGRTVGMCVCACVCACARARVCVCVCVSVCHIPANIPLILMTRDTSQLEMSALNDAAPANIPGKSCDLPSSGWGRSPPTDMFHF